MRQHLPRRTKRTEAHLSATSCSQGSDQLIVYVFRSPFANSSITLSS
jgi:hypothetical protein